MTCKELVRIPVLGCIQFCVFYMFSDILYLEMITLITVLFAMVFTKKEAILGSLIFAILNILMKQGLTIWSFMYLIIYPSYSLIACLIKPLAKKNDVIVIILCFVMSFMTGQLMQLPFMLISKKATMIYIIIGLKTSLIQAVITLIISGLLYKKLYQALIRIKGGI